MLLCWLQRIVSLLSYLIANRETVVMPAGIAGYFSRTIKIWVKVNPRCWCEPKPISSICIRRCPRHLPRRGAFALWRGHAEDGTDRGITRNAPIRACSTLHLCL